MKADYPAAYAESVAAGAVRCQLCPHRCVIAENGRGRCGIRTVRGGVLRATLYGRSSGVALDPIEKKPLRRFHPGATVLSLGSAGCNLLCPWCQNYAISTDPDAATVAVNAADLVRQAVACGAAGIAYTYNEPFMWFEFVRDCCAQARQRGLLNVLVTNGFVNPAPLRELLPLVDAMNIDIKALDDNFYQQYCGGSLEPVLQTVRSSAAACHVEITNLLIPGLNDSDAQITALRDWISAHVGADTPLHLTRYVPCYRLNTPPTPAATVRHAVALCRRTLRFVYSGNIAESDYD